MDIGYAAAVPSPRVLRALGLVAGLAALALIVHRFGGAALTLLTRHWHPQAFAAFLLAVAAALLLAAVRWQILLRGLGLTPRLAHLCAFRAAAQSVAAVLPGGRLGGEPLRVWYAMDIGVPACAAITTVAFDRALEMATGMAFAVIFGLTLVRFEVPGLDRAVSGVLVGATGLAVAIAVCVRRLRGAGLLTPIVARLGTTAIGGMGRTQVLEAAEDTARRLLAQPARLAGAAACGVAADLLTLLQFRWLLGAYDLPSTPIAVVAAIFAAGAARTIPVPGAVGTIEAAQLWLFTTLGHPPEIGLAVGIVTRLRDLAWAAPGCVVLLARGLRRPPA